MKTSVRTPSENQCEPSENQGQGFALPSSSPSPEGRVLTRSERQRMRVRPEQERFVLTPQTAGEAEVQVGGSPRPRLSGFELSNY